MDDFLLKPKQNKIINVRYALLIAVFVCVGICLANAVIYDRAYFFAIATVLIALCLFVVWFLSSNYTLKRKIFAFLVCVISSVLGAVSFSYTSFSYINENSHYGNATVSGKIVEVYTLGEDYYKIIVDDVFLNSKACSYKINMYISGENSFEIGNEIHTEAFVKPAEAQTQSSYASMVTQRIRYTAVDVTIINIEDGKISFFDSARLKIKNILRENLSYQEYSIAYALLTGDTEEISDTALQNFRYGGIAHVFAVSGMHVGFLAMVLNYLLGKLRPKPLTATIITFILFCYAGVCGFSVSSLRACIMSAVLLFTNAFGRKYDGMTGIGVSATVILLFSPFQLFTAGFSLSFSVVFALALFSRSITKKLNFLGEKISASVSAVLSAELGSIPVSILCFGYFSPLAFILNLVILPLITLIFCLSMVCVLLDLVFGVAFFSLVGLLIRLVLLINQFEFYHLVIFAITIPIGVVVYILGLAICSEYLNIKKRLKALFSLILVGIFVATTVSCTVDDMNTCKITINSNEYSQTVLIDGSKNILVVNKATFLQGYSLNNTFKRNNVRKLDYVVAQTGIDPISITDFISAYVTVGEVVYFEDEFTLDYDSLDATYKYHGLTLNDVYTENGVTFQYNEKYLLSISIDRYDLAILGVEFNEEESTQNFADYDMIGAQNYSYKFSNCKGAIWSFLSNNDGVPFPLGKSLILHGKGGKLSFFENYEKDEKI